MHFEEPGLYVRAERKVSVLSHLDQDRLLKFGPFHQTTNIKLYRPGLDRTWRLVRFGQDRLHAFFQNIQDISWNLGKTNQLKGQRCVWCSKLEKFTYHPPCFCGDTKSNHGNPCRFGHIPVCSWHLDVALCTKRSDDLWLISQSSVPSTNQNELMELREPITRAWCRRQYQDPTGWRSDDGNLAKWRVRTMWHVDAAALFFSHN